MFLSFVVLGASDGWRVRAKGGLVWIGSVVGVGAFFGRQSAVYFLRREVRTSWNQGKEDREGMVQNPARSTQKLLAEILESIVAWHEIQQK